MSTASRCVVGWATLLQNHYEILGWNEKQDLTTSSHTRYLQPEHALRKSAVHSYAPICVTCIELLNGIIYPRSAAMIFAKIFASSLPPFVAGSIAGGVTYGGVNNFQA